MFCPIEPLHKENRPKKKAETELFGSKRSNLQLTQSKALKMLDLDYDNFEFVVKQGRKDDIIDLLSTAKFETIKLYEAKLFEVEGIEIKQKSDFDEAYEFLLKLASKELRSIRGSDGGEGSSKRSDFLMMTGVALDHEDKLDDILKGLEDLNKTEEQKRNERKKKKGKEGEEDDVFDSTISFVSKASKWKGKASTSELEKERAKVQPTRTKSLNSSFKTAAKANMVASAFGAGATNKKPSPRGSTSGSDHGGSSKLTRTKSDKVKKAPYKTAENKDGTMTRTYSQKYK